MGILGALAGAIQQSQEISGFLLDIQRLVDGESVDEALDLVYETFDLAFTSGDFRRVDYCLALANVRQFDPCTMLAFLSASLPAQTQLEYRTKYSERVRKSLLRRGWSETRVFEALHGLV